jgi:hypothetical protein
LRAKIALRTRNTLNSLRTGHTLHSLWTRRAYWASRTYRTLITFWSLVGDRYRFNRDIGLQDLDIDTGVLLERDAVIDSG